MTCSANMFSEEVEQEWLSDLGMDSEFHHEAEQGFHLQKLTFLVLLVRHVAFYSRWGITIRSLSLLPMSLWYAAIWAYTMLLSSQSAAFSFHMGSFGFLGGLREVQLNTITSHVGH